MLALKFLIIFFLSLSSWGVDSTAVGRGNFGPFGRSLNDKREDYQLIEDPTGSAPTKKVEKFLVRNGDCGISDTWNDCETDRERSEISEIKGDNKEGGIYWYGWSIYFPNSYPFIFPAKVALGQFHEEGVSALWMFQQNDKGYELEASLLKQDKLFPLIPIESLKGRWHRVEMEVRWTQTKNGYLRVWVDGEQKVNYEGPTMQKAPLYFKYGLYRSFLSRFKKATGLASVPQQEVYYSNVKRANSRKEILP